MSCSESAFAARIQALQARTEAGLAALFEREAATAPRLHAAMRYASLNGGKRIRPILVHLACAALGGRPEQADAAALAIELVHCYSLVHDDLPCMDNDDLRRGQPTCHRQFDEATALLAGDSLQTLAFRVLADAELPADTRATAVATLAEGSLAMAMGQQLDLEGEGQALTLAELETIHRNKTGALIRASARLGGLVAGASAAQLAALDAYAGHLGLAFQVQDDVLDVTSDTATLGKTAGADQALNKATYPALLGLEAAQRLALDLHQQAIAALAPLPNNEELRALADWLLQRKS